MKKPSRIKLYICNCGAIVRQLGYRSRWIRKHSTPKGKPCHEPRRIYTKEESGLMMLPKTSFTPR